ncbi:MAG TPA: hypothetical protein VHC22_31255 [Pirellulales bacterium]|nr:hypothetical protein [Pirellulales bacterium]
MAPPAPSEIQKRATRLVAAAPKIPLLGLAIRSGVGLTGILLALLGYETSLAMFGGMAVATLTWIVLSFREVKPVEEPFDEELADRAEYERALSRYGVGSAAQPITDVEGSSVASPTPG